MNDNVTLLSICIPTFNRLHCLENCLNSIKISNNFFNFPFEVCISDNNPDANARELVSKYQTEFSVNYHCNKKNIGLGKNIVKSVSLARGKYVWVLGNDDLLLPHTFKVLQSLLYKENIDYFYINSINLHSKNYNLLVSPIDTNKLPSDLETFSKVKHSFKCSFFELVDPNISFDFMLGMFLSIIKKAKWDEGLKRIKNSDLSNPELYSTFDNTCPHVKIFATSLNSSQVWFQAKPLSANMIGEREWGNLYPFVDSIRIPEVLDLYYNNGLPFLKYLKCKNFALKRFLPNLFLIVFSKKFIGLKYISFRKHIFPNIFFPNIYIFPFIYLFKKIFLR